MMLITVASYVASSVLPFAMYMGYKKYINRNVPTVLTKPSDKLKEQNIPLGLSVIDYEIPPETEEEYLKRLKHIHSKAWQEYCNGYSKKSLLVDQDRFLSMLLLKYRNGEVTAKTGAHTIQFSEGTAVWIANKYYAYANIYECDRPGMKHEHNDGRLSPYAFMSIVDLEMELGLPHAWKKYHDEYTRSRVSSLKSILGL